MVQLYHYQNVVITIDHVQVEVENCFESVSESEPLAEILRLS